MTVGDHEVRCPSCGAPARYTRPQAFSANPFECLRGEALQTENSDQMSEFPNTNPLMEEIARRRQSIESSNQIQTEEPSLSLNNDLGRLNSNPSNSTEPSQLEIPSQSQSQPNAGAEQPPRGRARLVLVHTIFITGPHGGMIIRTTHLLPEPDETSDPDHHMNIEEPSQEEAGQTEANHDHHPSGLLQFLNRLNPLRLLGRSSSQSQQDQAHGEEHGTQGEFPDITMHHAASESSDQDGPRHPMSGTRILLNPFDFFSNGLDSLLEEIMRSMPDQNGAPPASEEALSQVQEYDYKPREESDICAVCHEDFHENDRVSKLPCKHEYHKDCVMKWLKMHNLCPICRTPLKEESQQNLIE